MHSSNRNAQGLMLRFAVAAVISAEGCSELDNTVTDYYATVGDAERDLLFERGWLPDIIPETATKIRITTDVGANTAIGSFYLAPTDVGSFVVEALGAESEQTSNQATVTVFYKEGPDSWEFSCSTQTGLCNFAYPKYEVN